MFAQLTQHLSGDPVWVSLNHIQSFERVSKGEMEYTQIQLIDSVLRVRESPGMLEDLLCNDGDYDESF